MILRIIFFALASAITLVPTSEATFPKHGHGSDHLKDFITKFFGHHHKQQQQQQQPAQQPASPHPQAGYEQFPPSGTVVSEIQMPAITGHAQSGPSVQGPIQHPVHHAQPQAPIQHGSVPSPSHVLPQTSIQGHVQTPSYPQHLPAPSHQYPTAVQENQPSYQVPVYQTHPIYQQGSVQQGPALPPTHSVHTPQAPVHHTQPLQPVATGQHNLPTYQETPQHTQPLQPVATGQHNLPTYQETHHPVQTPAPTHSDTNFNANADYKEHHVEEETGRWDIRKVHTVVGNLQGHTSSQAVPQPSGHVDQPSGHVNQPSGHVTQPSGHVTQPSGHVTQPSGHVTQPSGHVQGHVPQQVVPSNPLPSTGHVQQGGGIAAQPTPCYGVQFQVTPCVPQVPQGNGDYPENPIDVRAQVSGVVQNPAVNTYQGAVVAQTGSQTGYQTPQAGISGQINSPGLPSFSAGLTKFTKHHQPPANYQTQNSEYARSGISAEEKTANTQPKVESYPKYPMAKLSTA